MQPVGARGRVCENAADQPENAADQPENAADQPDAWVPLTVLRHVSVVRSPVVSSPVVSWLARSPACIAAFQFPRTSARGRVPQGRGSAENAADPPREQKKTQRDRKEHRFFSETADCELELPRNPQPRPAVLRAVVQSPSLRFLLGQAEVRPKPRFGPSRGSAQAEVRPKPRFGPSRGSAQAEVRPFPIFAFPLIRLNPP
jgi:hypothetical protein